LPVRVKTALSAGVVKRSARRTGRRRQRRGRVRLLDRSPVRFGQTARVSGRLADASGGPIAGADVLAFERLRRTGSSFRLIARLRTTSDGRFSYLAPAGASRTLLFRYPGTATVRPASHTIKLLVAASSTIAVSRHFALNGETITFSGRLRGQPAPESGKYVE